MKTIKLGGPLVAAITLAVGACAPIAGNERGGVIQWEAAGNSEATINRKVEEHCAKYGRRPGVQPNAQAFGVLSGQVSSYQFECVPPK